MRGPNACPLRILTPWRREPWRATGLMIHGKHVPVRGTRMSTWFFRRVRLSERDSVSRHQLPGRSHFFDPAATPTGTRVQRLQTMRSRRLKKNENGGERGRSVHRHVIGSLLGAPRGSTAEEPWKRTPRRWSKGFMMQDAAPTHQGFGFAWHAGIFPAHPWFCIIGRGVRTLEAIISCASRFGKTSLGFFFFFFGWFSAGNDLDSTSLGESHLVQPP